MLITMGQMDAQLSPGKLTAAHSDLEGLFNLYQVPCPEQEGIKRQMS